MIYLIAGKLQIGLNQEVFGMGRTEPQTMRAPEGMKRTIKASVFSDLFGDKK